MQSPTCQRGRQSHVRLRCPKVYVVSCSFCSMDIALDADAMIKLAKSSLKEIVLSSFSAHLPPQVVAECVDQGKEAGHPDALIIEENLERGRLQKTQPHKSDRVESLVKELRLGGGERDVIRLFRSGGVDVVVSDDRRFLQILQALGIPFGTTSSLIAALAKRGRIKKREAMDSLEKLRTLIGDEQYSEARETIEEAGP